MRVTRATRQLRRPPSPPDPTAVTPRNDGSAQPIPLYVGRLVLLASALLVPYAIYLTEADYRLPAGRHVTLFALLGGAMTAACDGLSASSRGYRTRAWLLYSVAVGLHAAWYAVLRLSHTG